MHYVLDNYIRPVFKRERNTMLHWWYTPDSYDTWVTEPYIDLEIDDKYDPGGAWEVSSMYLLKDISTTSVYFVSSFLPKV